MGLFGFLKKKNQEPESPRQISDAHTEIELQNAPAVPSVAGTALISAKDKNAPISIYPSLTIHEDIKYLLWFGDGPYKNLTEEQMMSDKNVFYMMGYTLTFEKYYGAEPSIIYTDLPVTRPDDESVIPRPPYFPKYRELTPEQRYIYLKLLSNPYNTDIDIGYVFILYYGLERHLLQGNFDAAFKAIIKLRDVHKNKSFQHYSGNALVLSALLKQKGEYALAFIESLDKEYEFDFSDNLFLLCYYSFDYLLTAKDIMRMAKTFEFTNNNYIEKNPDIFEGCLKKEISESTGTEKINLKTYITDVERGKLENVQTAIFANSSIIGNTVPVPLLVENLTLKNAMRTFLEKAHEKTKTKVAELRKTGNLTTEVSVPVVKKQAEKKAPLPPIDHVYLKAPSKKLNIIERHFFYQGQIGAFYARREEKPEYLELAIKACEDQIAMSKKAANEFLEEKRFVLKSDEEQMDDYKQLLKGIDVTAKYNGMKLPEGFNPHIHKGPDCIKIIKHDKLPEHAGFKRLCIIRENQGNYEEVIRLATQAKEEGWTGNWDNRIEKAKKKLGDVKK
jgi:hypothetical protein